MPDLTPEDVEDARRIAAARAVLALTEQQPTCTCEYPYPREIWDGHHPNCVTEQQPEQVSEDELADHG